MKAVCINNNGRDQFATIGKTYEIVEVRDTVIFKIIDNRGIVITTAQCNFKTLSEVRKEKLLKINEHNRIV